MLSWKHEEISDLYSLVEKYKTQAKPIFSAFTEHANKYGRKNTSVRNFYYKSLSEFSKNTTEAKKYGINLAQHKKMSPEIFSDEEKIKLDKIKSFVAGGMSVRRACYKLAEGDAKKMLRYQNKYRSQNFQKPQFDNVITMPKKTGLSDTEINSLFMGLVKLIKRCAMEQVSGKMEMEVKSANDALRRSLIELASKQKEIESLKYNFEMLKNEKLLLKEELGALRSETAKFLSKKIHGEKLSSLKNFVGKLDKSENVENHIK